MFGALGGTILWLWILSLPRLIIRGVSRVLPWWVERSRVMRMLTYDEGSGMNGLLRFKWGSIPQRLKPPLLVGCEETQA